MWKINCLPLSGQILVPKYTYKNTVCWTENIIHKFQVIPYIKNSHLRQPTFVTYNAKVGNSCLLTNVIQCKQFMLK